MLLYPVDLSKVPLINYVSTVRERASPSSPARGGRVRQGINHGLVGAQNYKNAPLFLHVIHLVVYLHLIPRFINERRRIEDVMTHFTNTCTATNWFCLSRPFTLSQRCSQKTVHGANCQRHRSMVKRCWSNEITVVCWSCGSSFEDGDLMAGRLKRCP